MSLFLLLMIWQSPGLPGWRKVNFINVTLRPHHTNIAAGLYCLATSPGFLPTLCEKWSGFFYVHRVFLSYTRDPHNVFANVSHYRQLMFGACVDLCGEYAEFTTHSPTTVKDEKGQFSHLGSTSISHCIYHTFPLSVGTFWSLPCGCIAHKSAYQGARFECAYAVWYAVISRSTQNHTNMHRLDWDMSTFPNHAMQKWASPSLSLVALYIVNPPYENLPVVCLWWRGASWIHGTLTRCPDMWCTVSGYP